MRRSVMVALTAFVLLAWPAHAQIFPPSPSSEPKPSPSSEPKPSLPTERVLIDATLWVDPPTDDGLCLALDAGQVTITVKRVTSAIESRPTHFHVYGLTADPGADLKLMVGSQEATGTTRVTGVGEYCWQIDVDAQETRGMSVAQRGGYVQTVSAKITHTP